MFEKKVQEKIQKLKEQNRRAPEYNDGILKYYSKGNPKLNLNGKARGENQRKIACRHLAYYVYYVWEKHIKDYHENLSSIENIAKQPMLRDCEYDARDRRRDFCHKIFPLEEFGAALKSMASSLQIGDQQCLLFRSECHCMTIAIRYKENNDGSKYYVIKFYNPNRTMVHQRILCKNLDVITKLTIKDFLSDKQIKSYFLKYKRGAFVSPNSKKTNKQLATKCNIRLKRDVQSSVYFNLEFGITDAVKELCRVILPSKKVDIKTKIRLLTAKNQMGGSGLFRAFYNGHIDTAKVFFDAIVSASNLSSSQKLQLLAVKDQNGVPILHWALKDDRCSLVTKICNVILESNLTSAQKFQLLAAKDQNGTSGLSTALRKGDTLTVRTFYHVLLKSDKLNSTQKVQLLAAKDQNGIPGSRIVFHNGCAMPRVTDFYHAVITSNLSCEQKAQLILDNIAEHLLTDAKTGTSRQYAGLQELCRTICKNPKLSLDRKVLFCIATGNVNWATRLIKTGHHSWAYTFFDGRDYGRMRLTDLRKFIRQHPSTKDFFQNCCGNFLASQNRVIRQELNSQSSHHRAVLA